jgi:hypothetical protein
LNKYSILLKDNKFLEFFCLGVGDQRFYREFVDVNAFPDLVAKIILAVPGDVF